MKKTNATRQKEGRARKTPTATWGKIKNWNKLSYAHKELLKKEICPFYKEVEPRKYTKKIGEYFHQKNNFMSSSEYLPVV